MAAILTAAPVMGATGGAAAGATAGAVLGGAAAWTTIGWAVVIAGAAVATAGLAVGIAGQEDNNQMLFCGISELSMYGVDEC